MKDFNKFFDAAYVINLEHRTDRWNSITKMANDAGLNLNRWNAVNAKDIDLDRDRLGKRVKHLSAIGCWKSHITLYEHAIEQGYENILVLEDDADFSPDLYNQISSLFDTFDFKDFDVIYLGAADKYPSAKIQENVHQCQYTLTTHAMIISRKGLYNILNTVKEDDQGKCSMSIDVLLAKRIQPLGKSFRAEPAIITTISGYSDIVGCKRSWEELQKTVLRQGIKHPAKWEEYENKAKEIIKNYNTKQLF